jgi:preprotein translocase subunit YajC
VATTGGIYGRITDVKESTVTLEIADKVLVKVDKSALIADPGEQAATAKK